MKKLFLFFLILTFFTNSIFSLHKQVDNPDYPTKFSTSGDNYIFYDEGFLVDTDNTKNPTLKSLSPKYTFSNLFFPNQPTFLKSPICTLSLQNNKINANWNFLNPKLKAWETFLLSKNANSLHKNEVTPYSRSSLSSSGSENLGKKILENNFWMRSKVTYIVENEEKPINISVDLDGLEYKDILERIFSKEKNAQKITLINITPIDKKCDFDEDNILKSNEIDGENFNFLNFTKQNSFILTNNASKIFFADNVNEKDKIVKQNNKFKLNNELLDLTKQTFSVKTKTNAENGEKIYGISDTFFLFHKIKNLDNKIETEKFINETLKLTKNHDIHKTVKSIENNRFRVTYKISGKQKGRAYLFIPKISVPNTENITLPNRSLEVLDKGPLIAWDYNKDFTYEAENPEGLVLIVNVSNKENEGAVTFSKSGCKTSEAHLFNLDNLKGSPVY